MKILQLCKKFPYPLKDGESIAITSLSRSFASLRAEVSLLAMNTSKHYFKKKNHFPSVLDHYKAIHTVDVDNRIKPAEAFKNLFSSESYHIQRFISKAFEDRLKQILATQTFDVIQLETLYLAPYIPIIRAHSDAIIAMRAHNVEHEIWERITKNTKFFPKHWYLKHLTKKLAKYEKTALNKYDILVAITKRDLETYRKMGFTKSGVVVPIGLDSTDYEPDFGSYQQPLSISFIGSLDWMPNQEGLVWFLEQVWGRLRTKFPKLELHIAGRNTPSWMYKIKKSGVKVHGEVPVAADFINQHSIMVVPLLSGSGMRAKILEGMALGRVVLTTSLGLEGIQAQHQQEVLIANTVADFVQQIDFCYQQNGTLEKIGRQAQDRIHDTYDSHYIAQRLLNTYDSFTVGAL
ncbi:MAG: glycosyltransferase family 4 protein [Bacteroidota bacterium]